MNKAEKIKTEIERLKAETFDNKELSLDEIIAVRNCYNNLLFFIDSLEEEPVSNDLEEAARKIATRHSHITGDTYYANDAWFFKKGALWQKEQDKSTIELAEDHAMLAGMEKMRQELIRNVVLETNVMKDNDGDGIDTPYEEWLTLEDTEIPFIPNNIGLKDGDKVKLIIIREE